MQPVSSDAPAYPDESSAKIPKTPCGTVKRAFRVAFPHTLPILAGFLLLGFAYGLLMHTKGFSFLYPMCMVMTIFGSSLEYVTVSMLLSLWAVSAGQVRRDRLEEAAAHLWPVRRNLLHHLLRRRAAGG